MTKAERYKRCKEEHRCPNCFNKHESKFLYCDKCREWRKRYRKIRYCKDCGIQLNQEDKSKRCPECKKAIKKTYWKSWYAGLSPQRKQEVKNQYAEYMRQWRKNNPEKYQNSTLQRRYDITFYIAQELYEKQDGKCAICGISIPQLTDPNKQRNNWAHIDHNHITNEVRGLLCPPCNYLLGHCNDNIQILKNAIKYLQTTP